MYVDITTVPVWAGDTVTAVDLDLDVVRGWTGRVWVDDEDEFAAHRVRYGYPSDLVRLAAALLRGGPRRRTPAVPPYDGRAPGAWFEVLAPSCAMEVDERGDRIARDVVVHGRVQGVFFRDSCRREARTPGSPAG